MIHNNSVSLFSYHAESISIKIKQIRTHTRGREREKERKRDRDKESVRERYTQGRLIERCIQRDRERETEKQKEREKKTERERESESERNSERDRKRERESGTQAKAPPPTDPCGSVLLPSAAVRAEGSGGGVRRPDAQVPHPQGTDRRGETPPPTTPESETLYTRCCPLNQRHYRRRRHITEKMSL